MRSFSLLQVIMVAILMVSCRSASTAILPDMSHYTVKSGDTLYSIAWKYKLDHKELGQWNNIGPPFRLHVGQKIRLTPAGTRVGTQHGRSSVHVVKRGDTLTSIARVNTITLRALKRANRISGSRIVVGQRLKIPPANSTHGSRAHAYNGSTQSRKSMNKATLEEPVSWGWPARGRVVSRFRGADSTQQGIDITGRLNQPIKSIARGKVVYTGTGVIKHGHTVIVMHSNSIVSCYAYNKSVNVRVGDWVKKGQVIAQMGYSPQLQPRLHLEIRRKTTPINPLKLLPKR